MLGKLMGSGWFFHQSQLTCQAHWLNRALTSSFFSFSQYYSSKKQYKRKERKKEAVTWKILYKSDSGVARMFMTKNRYVQTIKHIEKHIYK